jgi:spermidine synthase
MKEFIYSEMMVHVPLCTHKDPQDVLIISNNSASLVAEVQKHTDISCDVISESLDLLREVEENKYDVVICELEHNPAVVAHINRVTKSDALFVMTHPSLDEVEANKTMMEIVGKYAKIVMPYTIQGDTTALLASKEYHPTADIILQRGDLLDGLEYYNSDVHPASFAMGNYIRKRYLGIIKN